MASARGRSRRVRHDVQIAPRARSLAPRASRDPERKDDRLAFLHGHAGHEATERARDAGGDGAQARAGGGRQLRPHVLEASPAVAGGVHNDAVAGGGRIVLDGQRTGTGLDDRLQWLALARAAELRVADREAGRSFLGWRATHGRAGRSSWACRARRGRALGASAWRTGAGKRCCKPECASAIEPDHHSLIRQSGWGGFLRPRAQRRGWDAWGSRRRVAEVPAPCRGCQDLPEEGRKSRKMTGIRRAARMGIQVCAAC